MRRFACEIFLIILVFGISMVIAVQQQSTTMMPVTGFDNDGNYYSRHFIDVKIRFDLEGESKADVSGLPLMVEKIREALPESAADEEDTMTVCIELFRSSAMEIQKMLVTKSTRRVAIEVLLDSAFGNSISVGSECRERSGAQRVRMYVRRVSTTRIGELFYNVRDHLRSDPFYWMRRNGVAGIVAVNTLSSSQTTQIAVYFYDPPAIHDLQVEQDFGAAVGWLGQLLSKHLPTLVEPCRYRRNETACFYHEEEKCARDLNLTTVANGGTTFCGIDVARLRKPCDRDRCDSLCDDRLDAAPCRGECDVGVRNLSIDGDGKFTKYCKIRHRPCTLPPCPTTTPAATTTSASAAADGDLKSNEERRAFKKALGIGLMCLGALMFAIAAVVAFVLIMVKGRRKKKKNPAKIKPTTMLMNKTTNKKKRKP